MALVSANGMWLSRAWTTPALLAENVRTSGIIEALAAGKLTLASSGDQVVVYSATSNVSIGGAGSSNAFVVGSNLVAVNADLNVLGGVSTSSIRSDSADLRIGAWGTTPIIVGLNTVTINADMRVLGSSETFGQLTMTSLSDRVVISSAASNVLIGGGGNSNTLVIGSNLVTVNADFKVLGNVETVYTSELHVTDALVVVAAGAPSNDATVLTSGAGLLVADAASSGTVDERSFRWRAGVLAAFDGSNSPAAGGASNAGCWDVMGGSLRLTASFAAGVGGAYAGQPGKAVAREVSYGWRVNEADESELFKRVLPTSCNGVEADASYRRVLCVGGRAPVSGTSAISLNLSANPW